METTEKIKNDFIGSFLLKLEKYVRNEYATWHSSVKQNKKKIQYDITKMLNEKNKINQKRILFLQFCRNSQSTFEMSVQHGGMN